LSHIGRIDGPRVTGKLVYGNPWITPITRITLLVIGYLCAEKEQYEQISCTFESNPCPFAHLVSSVDDDIAKLSHHRQFSQYHVSINQLWFVWP
jgi:hypothetical protein